MFWSGNYIAVRELNFLLKEENVSLTQVLEADDILQECKADNKALIQFLTKPEVLAELITLITEEPPKNVELASQYRHASIACEVLTSHLSTLADRLSLDTVQMNRLCDFINREPPLNPLLASYFSKTVEMLLERSPKQDWYLYHIVCLRVLDFFRSRRDFLPNLLRHVATSAVADTFKYLLRLDDLFNKIVMEWLDEHQFLESLIQIICGEYVPEPIRPHAAAAASAPAGALADGADAKAEPEKAEAELSEKPDVNHKEEDSGNKEEKSIENSTPAQGEEKPAPTYNSGDEQAEQQAEQAERAERAELAPDKAAAEARRRAVAAANAAALLCDLILNGCAGEGCTTRLRTVWVLVSRLQSEEWVRALLGAMFTSPPAARAQAVVHGCQVLLALLSTDPILAGQCAAERTSVELAVAPHLPLLHQALLLEPRRAARERGRVGAARVHVAALLAQLALSEVEDVPTTMITLGTPGALVDLFFRYPDNNFLHAQVYALLKHALANRAYCAPYATHLLVECDLLNRLMDVFEENENKRAGVARAGYSGHVLLMLRRLARALAEQDGELLLRLRLPDAVAARWAAFSSGPLAHHAHQHDTPLGGYYPSENIYEVENMTDLADSMEASYDFNDMGGSALGELGELGELGGGGEAAHEAPSAQSAFLELANQRFDDDMWDDSPDDDADSGAASAHDVQDVLAAVAPWESSLADGDSSAADDNWAQFSCAPAPPPADPFAPLPPGEQFAPFWPSSDDTNDIPDDIMRLSKFSISATFPDQMNEHVGNATQHIHIDNRPAHSDSVVPNNVNNIDAKHEESATNKLDVDNDNTITATDSSDSSDSQNSGKCETPSVDVTEPSKEHSDS